MDSIFDIAVIGGGINGCGIAADAALRGLSVILLEKNDIASKTSSCSTKLIHGGLRYLEHFNFSLVKKSLNERQTLLTVAPHLVRPLPIFIPYQPSLRPSWLIRLGLFTYDHLSRLNTLPHSRLIKSSHQTETYFSALNLFLKRGFLFYDAMTDDARLSLANALQAQQYGAKVQTYTPVLNAVTVNDLWQISTAHHTLHARVLINATGPWVNHSNSLFNLNSPCELSLVKGSHLVLPALYKGDHAYLLQHQDKRIIFVIPYHGYSLVGTTDKLLDTIKEPLHISEEEISYLLQTVTHYFNRPLSPQDIITSWSGIRPLLAGGTKTPQTLSRDYHYHLTHTPAPAVMIYGGKITTYRQLAKDVIDSLWHLFPSMPASRTQETPLPGATPLGMNYTDYCETAYLHFSWMDKKVLTRLLQTYGTHIELILDNCKQEAHLGYHFGHGLYQREVDYLLAKEWLTTSADLLWRRTKLGLWFEPTLTKELDNYIRQQLSVHSAKKEKVLPCLNIEE